MASRMSTQYTRLPQGYSVTDEEPIMTVITPCLSILKKKKKKKKKKKTERKTGGMLGNPLTCTMWPLSSNS